MSLQKREAQENKNRGIMECTGKTLLIKQGVIILRYTCNLVIVESISFSVETMPDSSHIYLLSPSTDCDTSHRFPN